MQQIPMVKRAAWVVVALAGCMSSGKKADGGATGVSMTTAPKTVQLDDAQVAHVFITLNNGEVDVAKVALPKLQDESVRGFANMMASAHTQANQDFAQLTGVQSIEPQANDVSRALEDGVQTAVNGFGNATTASADQQYIHSQVTMHRAALALLDCVMTQSKHNEALTSHLRNTARATVASHLRQARAVESNLSTAALSGSGTTGSAANAPGSSAPMRAGPDSDNIDCSTMCDASTSPFDGRLRSAVCQPRPAS
ncbi:MAG: DUF4142 domain-containing protein [Myxococcaceae bacterium]|nr:DUF4142 domain-containing protein [Myxococcaceae bacterium]